MKSKSSKKWTNEHYGFRGSIFNLLVTPLSSVGKNWFDQPKPKTKLQAQLYIHYPRMILHIGGENWFDQFDPVQGRQFIFLEFSTVIHCNCFTCFSRSGTIAFNLLDHIHAVYNLAKDDMSPV